LTDLHLVLLFIGRLVEEHAQSELENSLVADQSADDEGGDDAMQIDDDESDRSSNTASSSQAPIVTPTRVLRPRAPADAAGTGSGTAEAAPPPSSLKKPAAAGKRGGGRTTTASPADDPAPSTPSHSTRAAKRRANTDNDGAELKCVRAALQQLRNDVGTLRRDFNTFVQHQLTDIVRDETGETHDFVVETHDRVQVMEGKINDMNGKLDSLLQRPAAAAVAAAAAVPSEAPKELLQTVEAKARLEGNADLIKQLGLVENAARLLAAAAQPGAKP
jgi:hypothetical protein